ncbi:hypothetical protein PBI_THONKO_69 [Mycobacterium phage Thonko]|uniref:Uncharacterized protein n=1 Tax=Mycobacterium phage Thonko TaxID=2282910 RepID=A0A346FCB6_9CAUD|nr:hypothetical protein I5G57_gp069 [Mycobacterium phage Thonko]AXN53341.1 hypothetical protein PBI_THONKO_69 [Mycobacterium phage Thonko]
MTDLITAAAIELAEHGDGWIGNGTGKARCRCGHQASLGESWHRHTAAAMLSATAQAAIDGLAGAR